MSLQSLSKKLSELDSNEDDFDFPLDKEFQLLLDGGLSHIFKSPSSILGFDLPEEIDVWLQTELTHLDDKDDYPIGKARPFVLLSDAYLDDKEVESIVKEESYTIAYEVEFKEFDYKDVSLFAYCGFVV